MTYTITVTIPEAPAAAEERVRAALAEEGFGILSEIDVEAALSTKLGEEIGAYKILGACNPALAHQGIGLDADLGALLPCNVVIRANGDGTDVVAADPGAMLQMAGAGLSDLACEAKERIERALASLVD